MFKNKNSQSCFYRDFVCSNPRMLKKEGGPEVMPGGSERIPDTKGELEGLKENIGVPKEVLRYIDKNRTYLKGVIKVAIRDLNDAYDKKFPGNSSEEAYQHFHKTSTFYKDPKVQEMFRLYARSDKKGRQYIQHFIHGVPEMWSDAAGLIFWGDREDGMTFNIER